MKFNTIHGFVIVILVKFNMTVILMFAYDHPICSSDYCCGIKQVFMELMACVGQEFLKGTVGMTCFCPTWKTQQLLGAV